MTSTSGGNAGISGGTGSSGMPVSSNQSSSGSVPQTETAQLTSELQLIENTIKDREREILINRNTDMTDSTNEGTNSHEYGAYGLTSDADDNGMPQSITTTARSGHITRTNGNYFDPM
jgi:hypothetical protein